MSEDDETTRVDESSSGSVEAPDRYRWDGDTDPSVAVVQAVAAYNDRDPMTLPPLQRTVDADALDDLFTDDADESLSLSFEYVGVTVTLRGSGVLEVAAP